MRFGTGLRWPCIRSLPRLGFLPALNSGLLVVCRTALVPGLLRVIRLPVGRVRLVGRRQGTLLELRSRPVRGIRLAVVGKALLALGAVSSDSASAGIVEAGPRTILPASRRCRSRASMECID